MLTHYGNDHGFGWKTNEIVGAQIVSVPMSVAIEKANSGFRSLLISLGAIFLFTIGLMDAAVYTIVIRPLRRVSRNADIISKGDIDLPPLEVRGGDEIAEVTSSFNRMQTSLIKAFEMLNGSSGVVAECMGHAVCYLRPLKKAARSASFDICLAASR